MVWMVHNLFKHSLWMVILLISGFCLKNNAAEHTPVLISLPHCCFSFCYERRIQLVARSTSPGFRQPRFETQPFTCELCLPEQVTWPLSVLWAHYSLQNKNGNSTYLTGLLWGLNDFIYVNSTGQHLLALITVILLTPLSAHFFISTLRFQYLSSFSQSCAKDGRKGRVTAVRKSGRGNRI